MSFKEEVIEKYLNFEFGAFVVIDVIEEKIKRKKRVFCLCRCKCGTIKKYPPYTIRVRIKNSLQQSCGCIKKTLIGLRTKGKPAYNRKSFGEACSKKQYGFYKSTAKRRGHTFTLTFEEFINITTKNCFYCNSSPSNITRGTKTYGEFVYNGIDRIDSSKGYENNNVTTCCKWCNFAKNDRTKEEFIEWAHRLSNNLKDNVK